MNTKLFNMGICSSALKRVATSCILMLLTACTTPKTGQDAYKGAFPESLNYNVVTVTPAFKFEQSSNNTACYARQDRDAINNYEYKLGKGDRLFIKLAVINSSETYRENHGSDLTFILPQPHLSQEESSFAIDGMGNINVPYAGTLSVEGLTVGELQLKLIERFKKYVRNPYADVKVYQFRSKFIEVQGQITHPQRLEIDDQPMTITRALKLAGGISDNADLKAAFVESKDGNRKYIDLFSLLSLGENRFNLLLEPGDTLVVPYTDGNEVYVTGEVIDRKILKTNSRPVSLTQAVMEANGPHPFAGDSSRVFVIRNAAIPQPVCEAIESMQLDMISFDVNSDIDVYHFDMRKPEMYVLANQFQLRKNDVVYVATRPITDWQRFITQILPANISFWTDPRTYK